MPVFPVHQFVCRNINLSMSSKEGTFPGSKERVPLVIRRRDRFQTLNIRENGMASLHSLYQTGGGFHSQVKKENNQTNCSFGSRKYGIPYPYPMAGTIGTWPSDMVIACPCPLMTRLMNSSAPSVLRALAGIVIL